MIPSTLYIGDATTIYHSMRCSLCSSPVQTQTVCEQNKRTWKNITTTGVIYKSMVHQHHLRNMWRLQTYN